MDILRKKCRFMCANDDCLKTKADVSFACRVGYLHSKTLAFCLNKRVIRLTRNKLAAGDGQHNERKARLAFKMNKN